MYKRLFNENTLYLSWDKLPFKEKVKRIAQYPYTKEKYYHVTDEDNISSIISRGIIGEEIWVSKGKPVYSDGICLELDLKNIRIERDNRWKKSDDVFVALEPIPPKAITKIFLWIDKLKIREDELAIQFDRASKEEIIEFIETEKI
jgi:hypothetical protein